jgi:hypothetical protein
VLALDRPHADGPRAGGDARRRARRLEASWSGP